MVSFVLSPTKAQWGDLTSSRLMESSVAVFSSFCGGFQLKLIIAKGNLPTAHRLMNSTENIINIKKSIALLIPTFVSTLWLKWLLFTFSSSWYVIILNELSSPDLYT